MTTRTKKARNEIGLCVMVVTSCLVLTGLWAVLATPEATMAAKPVKENIRFKVTATEGAMVITNVNEVEGRYSGTGGTQVVVNRPSVKMRMAFLENALLDFQNYVAAGYGYSGTLVIQQDKGVGHAVFFFKGPGKYWVDGDKLTGYRIDTDANIVPSAGFPTGDNKYTVDLSNIELSVDTGSRKNGHEGIFLGAATVELTRTP